MGWHSSGWVGLNISQLGLRVGLRSQAIYPDQIDSFHGDDKFPEGWDLKEVHGLREQQDGNVCSGTHWRHQQRISSCRRRKRCSELSRAEKSALSLKTCVHMFLCHFLL